MSEAAFVRAMEVCLAYRKKSVNFRGELLGSSFKFFVRQQSCAGKVTRGTVDSRLRSPASDTSMIFTAESRLPYVDTVQTHNSGYLAQTCPRIIKGERIYNPTYVKNGISEVEITFLTEGEFHYLLRFFKEKGGKKSVSKVIRYKVETSDKNFGTRVGMATKVEQLVPCLGEDSTHQVLTQVYIGGR